MQDEIMTPKELIEKIINRIELDFKNTGKKLSEIEYLEYISNEITYVLRKDYYEACRSKTMLYQDFLKQLNAR